MSETLFILFFSGRQKNCRVGAKKNMVGRVSGNSGTSFRPYPYRGTSCYSEHLRNNLNISVEEQSSVLYEVLYEVHI